MSKTTTVNNDKRLEKIRVFKGNVNDLTDYINSKIKETKDKNKEK